MESAARRPVPWLAAAHSSSSIGARSRRSSSRPPRAKKADRPLLFLIKGQAARLDRIAAAGDRCIGGRQLDQAHARGAERQAWPVGQRRVDAKVARGADDVLPPDLLGEPHRRGIARPGEGLAQGDRAAIDAVIVARRPAVDA